MEKEETINGEYEVDMTLTSSCCRRMSRQSLRKNREHKNKKQYTVVIK